jgi:predicted dehydrogenase
MKKFLILTVLVAGTLSSAFAQKVLNVCIAGLTHDHIHGILNRFHDGSIHITGIAEADKSLQRKYAKLYHLPDSIFYDDLKAMVIKKKPDAVLGYNAVALHVDIVEICAPLGISVMVEKPLAATLDQAKRMEQLALKYHIKLLTNYETTWYASYAEMYQTINKDSIGRITKMVLHDGHQGPKEIGCSEAFLSWLTDPLLNGAGALNDFGCYGADLMTWLLHGQEPVAVTAIARHYKPEVYPKVEDDATIMVEYPKATGLIEASWNWPFSIKDLEVFGQTGYLHGLDKENIVTRMRENRKSSLVASPLPAPYNDPVAYLTAVLQNKIQPGDDQSSLRCNMTAMRILDAAKRSIKEGKRIVL